MKDAWIIAVNMGYGHQRTAHPLRDLAFEGKIINANSYEGIPEKDKTIWESMRRSYEILSRFSRIPLIGKAAFSIYDQFQKILGFYPKRDLSKPNFALKQIYSLLKKGWGKDLVEKLKIKNEKLKINLPIISTFFIPAFMAEFFNYPSVAKGRKERMFFEHPGLQPTHHPPASPAPIFCVVCDADISRTWAPLTPSKSKIKYFAPTERVVERLKQYGVKEENIFLTGYPLPLENIGSSQLEILKEDLKCRILNLDPQKKYFEKYKILIEENLGKLPEKSDHPLTIMFSVGGAGVQKEIGIKILKSLISKIKQAEIKVILSAGIREKIKEYFENNIKRLGLKGNKNIEIIFAKGIESYFQNFNSALRKTDILWTKPSELSFYSALGIPIIIAPPIGSQEEFNMRWLLKSGLGIFQENPNYAQEWLFDWLGKGYLAECAIEGFIEGEKLGTLNISRILSEFSTKK